MGSGSIEIVKWLEDGAMAGDPIMGPLSVVAFGMVGLYNRLSEAGLS
ncbi:hypothetical protein [Rhodococcus daqingensis]|uniref:Uncharacterized protein n=1 Tax=Rhodococcus daqingensis TaxID=2479363 RepID=A0ABW2RXJ1_9NOCA